MLLDTDVLIWNLRGNQRASEWLDSSPGFTVSAVTYMELVQGLRDQSEFRALRQAMQYWDARIQPVSEAISNRATFLVETYALSHNMQMADALIAASATQLGLPLVTANDRHYRHIEGLEIHLFRPEQGSAPL
ncbi:type II toxin-antitoxin system VapC family toxin [Thioalkalivibrio sp. HL-Eb18]|uniref:type II toxin-antitoxin system VapC family toxin n=1 Tax=Thioalkalivibrio sp. HL-Eb18 TaxID=1266913 RepID=UPI0003712A87|nr:type II toxin-antitoxin system VapC family toxin [Thioalkalivibrio sp. HL-Eb18]